MTVPKLRFKVFDDDWKNLNVEDIGDVKMCRRVFNHETTPIGDIPFFKIGSFGKSADAFITKELFLNYKQRFPYPKVGDILISAAGTIGRTVVFNGQEAYFQDSNIVWINNDEKIVLNSYFKYILEKVRFNTEGGTIQRLYNNILLTTKFAAPNLAEQQKIADFLTSVDEKINLLKKKKELLEQYKKGVMQKIFSQELRFKDDEGNDFPEWEEKKLGEVTYKTDLKNKKSVKYPIYSINNVNGFVPQNEQFDRLDSNDRGYDISLYKIIEHDTFAYNPARINVGSLGYYGGNEKVIVSSLYVCFKSTAELNNSFLRHFFKSDYFNQEVLRKGEGGVRIYLFFENFSEISISYPTSLQEQQKIADFLSALDDKIDLVEQQITQTELWKKGLLQQMFV